MPDQDPFDPSVLASTVDAKPSSARLQYEYGSIPSGMLYSVMDYDSDFASGREGAAKFQIHLSHRLEDVGINEQNIAIATEGAYLLSQLPLSPRASYYGARVNDSAIQYYTQFASELVGGNVQSTERGLAGFQLPFTAVEITAGLLKARSVRYVTSVCIAYGLVFRAMESMMWANQRGKGPGAYSAQLQNALDACGFRLGEPVYMRVSLPSQMIPMFWGRPPATPAAQYPMRAVVLPPRVGSASGFADNIGLGISGSFRG